LQGYKLYKLHKLYKHYIRRYGLWWTFKNFFRIKRQIIMVEKISDIWSSKAFDHFNNFNNSKYEYSFSFSQIENICLEYINKKAQNYQNKLNGIFKPKNTIKEYKWK